MIPFLKNRVLKSGNFVITKIALCGERSVCDFAKNYVRYFIVCETTIV